MPERGYVYALINPTLAGMVKVGKTTKDPNERAKELSSATGVPTPFLVAYQIYVADCCNAEKYVHTYLEESGYRVSGNREFFNAPLNEIIDAMLYAKNIIDAALNEYENQKNDPFFDASISEKDFSSNHQDMLNSIMEQATNHYYGLDDNIQDYREALKFYEKAAKLGSVEEAIFMLGCMYSEGEGCSKNEELALEYFKKGVSQGNDNCYAEMAKLFCYGKNKHIENSRKCWKKYFESKTFENTLPNHSKHIYVELYVNAVMLKWTPLENVSSINKIRNDIISHFNSIIENFNKSEKYDHYHMYKKLLRYFIDHFYDLKEFAKEVDENSEDISGQHTVVVNESLPLVCPYCRSGIEVNFVDLPRKGERKGVPCPKCLKDLDIQLRDKDYSCQGCGIFFNTIKEKFDHHQHCEILKKKVYLCAACKQENVIDDSEFDELEKNGEVWAVCSCGHKTKCVSKQ